MKRLWIAGLVASACLFSVSAAEAVPVAKGVALGEASSTIEIRGGHGHGRGHGWHGNRGRHLGWYKGRHRGWGHRHRHGRW